MVCVGIYCEDSKDKYPPYLELNKYNNKRPTNDDTDQDILK